jgi:hypothetical protein
MRSFFLKLYKWEFWPFWFFYIPVYFYWMYLSVRAKSLFFFAATNPIMEMGGFINYSKYNVLKLFPKEFIPKTLFIHKTSQKENIVELLQKSELNFPIIAKPDMGERGNRIAKVDNLEELREYFAEFPHRNILLQEYIDYALEYGIMFYRFSENERGTISSMVEKEFLTVCGDGKSTVRELIEADSRRTLYLEHLEEVYKNKSTLDQTPKKGKVVLLEPIGNHRRGTTFLDANHKINEDLLTVFDKLSQGLEGFYFGRYDIKAKSLEDLYAGKNFKIMELNGVNSEPAHIYDPKMPLWKAYRDLFRHWKTIYRIGTQKHQEGIPYLPFKEGMKHAFAKKIISYVPQYED